MQRGATRLALRSWPSGGGGSSIRQNFDVGARLTLEAQPVWKIRPGHHFARLSHSTSGTNGGRTRQRSSRNPAWSVIGLGAGGAALVTAFNLTTRDPVHSQEHYQHVAYDPSDPLSALSPHVLHNSTNHLTEASLSSLVRQYLVYLGSGLPGVVEAGPWILNKLEWTRDNVPIIGPVVWSFFSATIENTFYSVFVGGPTVPECAPVINMLADHGIGCLLNYGAEAKVDGSAKWSGVNDAHVIEAVNAVRQAAKFDSRPVTGQPTAETTRKHATSDIKPTLLAIKLTGMIWDPSLLARASLALENSTAYARGERLSSDNLFPESHELSDDDKQQLQKLYQGLRDVAREAKLGGVRLLIDAEQSWFQPAIDRMVDLLSEEFNKPAPGSTVPAAPIVYNTYQTYLRTTPPKMQAALAHADANGYSFGAKLVRGAYVEAERAKWSREGRKGDCIVWNNKQETDNCFDSCAELLSKRISNELKMEGHHADDQGKKLTTTAAFYASHNGTSMRKVLENLKTDGLAKVNENGLLELDDHLRGRISFGQLYGMSDNLTTALVGLIAPPSPTASSTLPIVTKYLPYATIEQALPYLIRRANENQSILSSDPTSGRGGAADERRAVGREIRRRVGIPF
ncbi:proline dehydrogenase [Microbotryomycetes sp. JL201]|nr:proline dehydrogenase [Microbotryomycetes sp. JL201]